MTALNNSLGKRRALIIASGGWGQNMGYATHILVKGNFGVIFDLFTAELVHDHPCLRFIQETKEEVPAALCSVIVGAIGGRLSDVDAIANAIGGGLSDNPVSRASQQASVRSSLARLASTVWLTCGEMPVVLVKISANCTESLEGLLIEPKSYESGEVYLVDSEASSSATAASHFAGFIGFERTECKSTSVFAGKASHSLARRSVGTIGFGNLRTHRLLEQERFSSNPAVALGGRGKVIMGWSAPLEAFGGFHQALASGCFGFGAFEDPPIAPEPAIERETDIEPDVIGGMVSGVPPVPYDHTLLAAAYFKDKNLAPELADHGVATETEEGLTCFGTDGLEDDRIGMAASGFCHVRAAAAYFRTPEPIS